MPKSKKKYISKINTPKKSKLPQDNLKSNEEFEQSQDDLQAEKQTIAELTQIKKEVLKLNKEKKDLTPEDRIEILQDYAIKKVKDSIILQKQLEQDTIKYKHQKRTAKNIDRSAIQKAKQQIRKVEIGYIEYYWDPKSKVYNWVPLHQIRPIITNPKKQELFLLDEPAKFINGKPVFILIKNIPFAIPMDFFIEDLYEKMAKMPNLPKDKEDKPHYGRADLSSTDLYAKYTSVKTIMLFGIKRSIIQSFAIYLFCFVLGMMTLYIVLSPYLFSK